MSIASIRPSTVDGIKSLAKKIKRERNVTHMEALDLASRQAGYENFVHAKRKLATALSQELGTASPSYPVYLVAHWQERPAPGANRRFGRELYRVDLSRPLPDVIPRHRLQHARNLRQAKMEYTDHIEFEGDIIGQAEARKALVYAARSLQFMDATGLVPPSNQREREIFRAMADLPHHDHTSRWLHPGTGEWLFMDEPYLDRIAPDRAAWLAERGLSEILPAWGGLYTAPHSVTRFVGTDVERLERIADLAARHATAQVPEVWPEPTGVHSEPYLSPARAAAGKPPRPRPSPSYADRMGATPYGGGPGYRSSWRPKQPLPIEAHRELGALLQSLSLARGLSARVSGKLDTSRLHLETWMTLEHKGGHGVDVADDVYFGGSSTPWSEDPSEDLAKARRAREIVEAGYNDCKPRRDLLAVLDSAAADLGKRQASPA